MNTRSVTGDSGMMEELPKKCWHIPDSVLQFRVIPILGWQAKEVSRCMLALNNFLLVSDHWLTDKYNRLQELEVWLFVQAVWYEVRHHSGHLALPVRGSVASSSSLQPWKGPISVCSPLALATLHSKRKPFLKVLLLVLPRVPCHLGDWHHFYSITIYRKLRFMCLGSSKRRSKRSQTREEMNLPPLCDVLHSVVRDPGMETDISSRPASPCHTGKWAAEQLGS